LPAKMLVTECPNFASLSPPPRMAERLQIEAESESRQYNVSLLIIKDGLQRFAASRQCICYIYCKDGIRDSLVIVFWQDATRWPAAQTRIHRSPLDPSWQSL